MAPVRTEGVMKDWVRRPSRGYSLQKIDGYKNPSLISLKSADMFSQWPMALCQTPGAITIEPRTTRSTSDTRLPRRSLSSPSLPPCRWSRPYPPCRWSRPTLASVQVSPVSGLSTDVIDPPRSPAPQEGGGRHENKTHRRPCPGGGRPE